MSRINDASDFGRCNSNAFGLKEGPKESQKLNKIFKHFDKMEARERRSEDFSFVALTQEDLL